MKLTRELLEKYFGVDDSMGKTCDCSECLIVDDILKNQEKALQFDELRRTLNELKENQRTVHDVLNAEKAQRYDDLMKANSEIVQHNIDVTKDHEIVERLKERKDIIESNLEELSNKRDSIMEQIDDKEPLSKELLEKIDSCGKIDDNISLLKKELDYLKSILENKK